MAVYAGVIVKLNFVFGVSCISTLFQVDPFSDQSSGQFMLLQERELDSLSPIHSHWDLPQSGSGLLWLPDAIRLTNRTPAASPNFLLKDGIQSLLVLRKWVAIQKMHLMPLQGDKYQINCQLQTRASEAILMSVESKRNAQWCTGKLGWLVHSARARPMFDCYDFFSRQFQTRNSGSKMQNYRFHWKRCKRWIVVYVSGYRNDSEVRTRKRMYFPKKVHPLMDG